VLIQLILDAYFVVTTSLVVVVHTAFHSRTNVVDVLQGFSAQLDIFVASMEDAFSKKIIVEFDHTEKKFTIKNAVFY